MRMRASLENVRIFTFKTTISVNIHDILLVLQIFCRYKWHVCRLTCTDKFPNVPTKLQKSIMGVPPPPLATLVIRGDNIWVEAGCFFKAFQSLLSFLFCSVFWVSFSFSLFVLVFVQVTPAARFLFFGTGRASDRALPKLLPGKPVRYCPLLEKKLEQSFTQAFYST